MVSSSLMVKDLLVKPKQLTATKVTNEDGGNGSVHFEFSPKMMLFNTVQSTPCRTLRDPLKANIDIMEQVSY